MAHERLVKVSPEVVGLPYKIKAHPDMDSIAFISINFMLHK